MFRKYLFLLLQTAIPITIKSKRQTMEEKTIRVLSVSFQEEITARELSAFRGAIAAKVGWENDWLHNQDNKNNGYHHRYARLQYKRHQGRPMLLCLENGVEEVQKFFMRENRELSLTCPHE